MKKRKDSVLIDGAILTVITLVAGLLLGLVHQVTAGPITAQEAKTKAEAQKSVFEEAESFSEDLDFDPEQMTAILEEAGCSNTELVSANEALNASGEKIGYVLDMTNSEGYGGDVGLMVGIAQKEDGSSTVNGISFLSLSETAGLGMKAKEPFFADQFKALDVPAEGTIGSERIDPSAAVQIDAISGATITSRAVVKDLNGALAAVRMLEGGAS